MKVKHWVNTARGSWLWILLLCTSNIFFIFAAWLAYPDTFKSLLSIMILFTIGSIIIGVLFITKKKERQRKAFYDFMREPSIEHEFNLMKNLGEYYKDEVHYLGDKLRLKKDELEDAKLKTRDFEEFIESWVHEIKTPISLGTMVLENRGEEMSQLVYLRFGHALISIKDYVEQILFYGRLHGAHVDYKLERISLILCIEDILLDLHGLLQENDVGVIFNTEEIPVVSDERSIQFILTQIVVNSAKYSKKEVNSLIWFETGFHSMRHRYYLKITDNGIGVLSSDLPFIFDKGFTGDNSKESHSTGIGLYLVKKLCDELRIEIEVRSEHGNGFEIELMFPVVENLSREFQLKQC